LAHFAFAANNYLDELADYIEDRIYDLSDTDQVGVSPYDVPWGLIDPRWVSCNGGWSEADICRRTGDLLTHPVCPDNAPSPSTFVNQSSRAWFEAQSEWPSGYLHHSGYYDTIDEVQEAVKRWVRMIYCFLFTSELTTKPPGLQISGTYILPAPASKGKRERGKSKAVDNDEIKVTLIHRGETTTWNLSIATSTRVLYCLAHRATKAQYARFTLRLESTKMAINDSTKTTLGLTDLSHGGMVEIAFAIPHRRRFCEVTVESSELRFKRTILLPQDASILALMSYLDRSEIGSMSEIQLWCVSDVCDKLDSLC
jgi:hypothetical protein